MKKKYEMFVHLVLTSREDADKFLKQLTPLEAATIIFMSERSAFTEYRQDIGDFLLRHYGQTPADGILKIWS